MDHLTADSVIILASMGGRPTMPEDKLEENASSTSSEVPKEGTSSGSNEKLSAAEQGEATGGLRERNTASRDGGD